MKDDGGLNGHYLGKNNNKDCCYNLISHLNNLTTKLSPELQNKISLIIYNSDTGISKE